ncbi:MAG: imidazole glycerol phosphate synthase subunit HisF [Elusimicrobia bacterium]|nr:imidazole glycerol phosphate synthase subunit HisF [Elusimicrobiota bacterium]
MLKNRLIPVLLLNAGRMVKGVRFGEFRDVGHPVTTARVYDAQGADELVFLDIQAAREGRGTLADVVMQVAEGCFMPLTVGGGVRSIDDFRRLLKAGADKVSINTAAVERPALISEAAAVFGAQCVVVSIDAKRNAEGRREVATYAGTKFTGLEPVAWAKEAARLGAGELLITSVDHEGAMKGYDLELTRQVAEAVDIPVVAHGGVGTLEHLAQGLREGKASAVAAASIFHFTDQSVIKAKTYLKQAGVEVRWPL